MPGLFEGFFSRHRKGATLAALVLVSLVCLLISNRTVVLRPKEIGLSVMGFFQRGATGLFGWFGDTADSIRQLQRHGLADPGLDPTTAAAVLGSMTNRFPELWLTQGMLDCSFEDGLEQLTRIFINALQLRDPHEAGEGRPGNPKA